MDNADVLKHTYNQDFMCADNYEYSSISNILVDIG